MVRKKVSISNRSLYTLIAVSLLVILGVGVYAFGTSNPSYLGHSANEIDWSNGVDGNVIFNDKVGIGTSNPTTNLHISGGLRIDNSLLSSANATAFGQYMTINLGGVPYLIPLYTSTGNFIGGFHTPSQCTSAGGSIVTVSGGDICRFNAAVCPSSWTQYQFWSTTQSTTTTLNPDSCNPDPTCTTGEHAWSNTPLEYCYINIFFDQYQVCDGAYGYQYGADTTQIGCY